MIQVQLMLRCMWPGLGSCAGDDLAQDKVQVEVCSRPKCRWSFGPDGAQVQMQVEFDLATNDWRSFRIDLNRI